MLIDLNAGCHPAALDSQPSHNMEDSVPPFVELRVSILESDVWGGQDWLRFRAPVSSLSSSSQSFHVIFTNHKPRDLDYNLAEARIGEAPSQSGLHPYRKQAPWGY